ncbi:hypothetical protein JEQ12_001662 [Ovis aries]|uniref:Uncharacterized protein n=1 Tax=Ovis aries TaxID=9940 RepID=A0A836AFM5_SHEEP|nr:hypothetical protein JEQ12_001662 [Ovis aries]
MTSRPTPLANAETGHPCAAPGQVLGGSLKSSGWGQRTGLAYAGYCAVQGTNLGSGHSTVNQTDAASCLKTHS